MRNFFKSLSYLIKGHLTIMKNAFRKRVTLEYPEKKLEHKNLRGKIAFNYETNCTGCGICQKVCPSKNTIQIITSQNNEGKKVVDDFQIDISKCIFCGNCVENCPQKAIYMTNEYELASPNKEDFLLKRNKNGNI